MKKSGSIKLFLVNAIGVLLSAPFFATDYNCVPVEVAVFDNRAHVACAEPPPYEPTIRSTWGTASGIWQCRYPSETGRTGSSGSRI